MSLRRKDTSIPPSLRIMASLRIPTFEEKIPVSYAFCGPYLLGTFLISHYLLYPLYPLYPLLSILLFFLRRKDTSILCEGGIKASHTFCEEKIPVSLLGCSLVFLLGKNKRRRDGFEGKTKACEAFSVPSFISHRKQLLSFLLYAQLVSLIPCLLCPLIEDKDHKKHRTLKGSHAFVFPSKPKFSVPSSFVFT